MPAEGFARRPTPELNRVFHQQHRDSRLKPPKGKLSETHFRLIRIIERHSEEELFTRQHYHWTGSTSPGSYLTSALPVPLRMGIEDLAQVHPQPACSLAWNTPKAFHGAISSLKVLE